MQDTSPADIQKRLPFLAGLVIFFVVVLFVRLWFLQVVNGAYYYDLAENNQIRPIKIRPPRGVIYDRHGRPIVENVLTFDISLVPEDAPDLEETIRRLGALVRIDARSIRQALADAAPIRMKYEPVKIKEEVGWEDVARVEAHQDSLPGVIVEPEHRRHYPYGGLASHQLGYVGKVTQEQRKKDQTELGLLTGQGGLEKTYDALLRGASGRRMIQINSSGRKVKDLGIEDPKPGTDLYLTIDLNVQLAAEEALGTRAGAVVAMDPNTGEILALVSHPTFDPNLFPRGISPKDWNSLMSHPSHPLYNRAIQSVYPPGSTFKIVTGLAALESGIVKPDDKVTCKGFIRHGKHTFRCWKRAGHGTLSFHRGLVESCDVYFYTIGERVGFEAVANYAKNLGLGTLTGVPLMDEKAGLIPTAEWKLKRTKAPWYVGDTYISSIGQGFLQVSPIQSAQMIGAVANGGFYYTPKLLKSTRNRVTGSVKEFPPEKKARFLFNPKVLEEMRSALIGVTSEPGGTGWGSRTEFATVAGKTGTAQVVEQKDASRKYAGKLDDHAWFVAYAPAEHPQIAVAVIVEHGGHGGAAAAPVAKKVFEEYFRSAGTKTDQ